MKVSVQSSWRESQEMRRVMAVLVPAIAETVYVRRPHPNETIVDVTLVNENCVLILP